MKKSAVVPIVCVASLLVLEACALCPLPGDSENSALVLGYFFKLDERLARNEFVEVDTYTFGTEVVMPPGQLFLLFQLALARQRALRPLFRVEHLDPAGGLIDLIEQRGRVGRDGQGRKLTIPFEEEKTFRRNEMLRFMVRSNKPLQELDSMLFSARYVPFS